VSETGRVEEQKPAVQYMSEIQNILGEVLWHSVTVDHTIESVSKQHRDEFLKQAKKRLPHLKKFGHASRQPRLLEVAAYAHVSGYMLAEAKDWQVTLSDCSVETLALGARRAQQLGLDIDRVRRAAVDFHDLPFEDGAFDVVYIASALHHTLRWQTVLRELMRVLATDGILILQNEPINRDFCFYGFETNRPGEYRPIEAELDRQGILQTVAQPYPGSRPEALFGMVENQNMPIKEILNIIESQGAIEQLDIDFDICMSPFEKKILKVKRDELVLAGHIQQELASRLEAARKCADAIDTALGKRLPSTLEIEVFARKAAKQIVALPDKSGEDYRIALANLFGGAIKVVARKTAAHSGSDTGRSSVYFSDNRKGVDIAFPPRLTRVLERTEDLVPDIQAASTSELEEYFNSDDWTFGENEELANRFVVLKDFAGRVILRPHDAGGRIVILVRIWADPSAGPFRVALHADDREVSGADVYQVESFLLSAELSTDGAAPDLSIRVKSVAAADKALTDVPPVTVGAVRIVSITEN